MALLRGTFELESPEGKKLNLKFGMEAAEIIEKESGKLVSETMKGIFDQGSDYSGSVINFFYGGAVSYAKSNNKEIPTRSEVADFIDMFDDPKALTDVILGALKMPQSPNPKAPTMGPEVSE